MNKNKIYLPVLLAIFLAAGVWLGSLLQGQPYLDRSTSTLSQKRKLNKLIDLIDQRYVDKVDTDSIVDLTVAQVLSQLDPHSVYISSDQASEVMDQMRGDFTGVGLRFYLRNDTINVLQAMPGGPSEQAGLKTGDRILFADGKPLFGPEGLSTDLLKGKEGSQIMLGVLRPNELDTIQVLVTRGEVQLPSVDAVYVQDKVLYVKISRFSENTYREFLELTEEIPSTTYQAVALDLRNNPGGVLQTAVEIADEFIEKDQLILFQEDREQRRKDTYAKGGGKFEDIPLYVLINESSASASEVIAGAVQDNDRGVVVGRRSFGKGLVQQEVELGDGSRVRLTVSRYYTPTGRSIQRPYDDGNTAYYKEYLDRYKNGELQNKESIEVVDSLMRVTPKGKVVYGGGGIIPDVFVPATEGYTQQTLEYFAINGLADQFTNRFLQTDGAYLREYDEQRFLNEFEPSEVLMQDFIKYAQLYNTSISLLGYRDEISLIIKSSLASQLFSLQLKYQLINNRDVMFKKVLSLESSISQ